jgi:hypothetical protein
MPSVPQPQRHSDESLGLSDIHYDEYSEVYWASSKVQGPILESMRLEGASFDEMAEWAVVFRYCYTQKDEQGERFRDLVESGDMDGVKKAVIRVMNDLTLEA